jgi:hypothetical protein
VTVIKIARFWPVASRPSRPERNAGVDAALAAGLDAFGSEQGDPSPPPGPPSPGEGPPRPRNAFDVRPWFVVLALVAAAGGGWYAYRYRQNVTPQNGFVTIETTQPGVRVFVGGKPMGTTPASIMLAPGSYDVRLGDGDSARTVKVDVAAGTRIVQHYETSPSSAVATGTLRIQTTPSALPVHVDGELRGTAPLTLTNITPGDHEVSVRGERPMKQTVAVAAGETASVILAMGAVTPPTATDGAATLAAGAGWLHVTAPISMQVREGGQLIGTAEVERLMLAAGTHELELGNEALGFQVRRKIQIQAGKSSNLAIDVPQGTISLNATPWAEVFLDGERVGETPIGNLLRPIGRHEVTFRHPELGERKEIITLTAQRPVRLGVDLRKK